MSQPLACRSGLQPEPFEAFAARALGGPLQGRSLETVQVNIGLVCNLSCAHCHVESSPKRRERMEWSTMLWVLELAERAGATTLDLTGGAPEMHPHFRDMIVAARARGLALIVRTNLTILLRPGYTELPAFFAEHRVRLIASLPCYSEQNVDRQRGENVFADSISALRRLNAVGYGVDPALALDLIYNPLGPTLPPPQAALEADYRRNLRDGWEIEFSRLLTLTNMPIGRFLQDLRDTGRSEEYVAMLAGQSAPGNVEQVMCRSQIHISHDGSLHDCDFNYALGLGLADGAPAAEDLEALAVRKIRTGEHCYGCTAGAGSSCGGALN